MNRRQAEWLDSAECGSCPAAGRYDLQLSAIQRIAVLKGNIQYSKAHPSPKSHVQYCKQIIASKAAYSVQYEMLYY